jgi:hypothetical protein
VGTKLRGGETLERVSLLREAMSKTDESKKEAQGGQKSRRRISERREGIGITVGGSE